MATATMVMDPITTSNGTPLDTFLADKAYLKIPKVGEVVHGVVVGIGRNEIQVDIPGYRTGLIRGPELLDPSGATSSVQVGDEVDAAVLDLENERGFVELSFRAAGHRKAWSALEELRRSGAITPVRIIEANKGGLVVELGRVQGFLPVSQLAPGNYPRVAGGDKSKILEKLRSFSGKTFEVKVLDVDATNEKLIVSEKAAWEQSQATVLAQYKPGDVVDGQVTALTDFGAFVKFPVGPADAGTVAEGGLEGLVHISELSWQRVDHPRDVLQVGDRVRVQVLNIEGSKIFLSAKRCTEDPWVKAAERYAVGQRVRGKVVRSQPFGLFVELDPQIHGLAHISELAETPPATPTDVVPVGEEREWMIISFDAKEHRLGLSLKPQADSRQLQAASDGEAPNIPDALPDAPSAPAES